MRVKLALLIFIFCLLIFLPFSVFAQTNNQKNVVLPKSQTINNNYFAAGSSVDVEGTVNSDAYVAGGNILINGTVHGDVLAAGGQITIRGSVQNIRVAGGQIVIDGKVNGNVTVAGGSVTITNGSQIAGSVVGVGGQIVLSGPIGKTVHLGGGQVTIGNSIGGDVSAMTQQMTLNKDAKISGNLWYQSQQKAQIDSGAVVSGKVTHAYPPQQQREAHPGAFLAGVGIFFSIAMLILEIIIGVILLALLPIYSQRMVTLIREHLWLSLGIGVLAWILTPFIAILLLVTIIGIPLTFIFIFMIWIFSYVGKLYAALFLGNWLVGFTHPKRINIYLAFIVGIIVIELLMLVPVLGWLFGAILSAIGFGAALIMEKNYYVELRGKKLI